MNDDCKPTGLIISGDSAQWQATPSGEGAVDLVITYRAVAEVPIPCGGEYSVPDEIGLIDLLHQIAVDFNAHSPGIGDAVVDDQKPIIHFPCGVLEMKGRVNGGDFEVIMDNCMTPIGGGFSVQRIKNSNCV